jgi:hypothetical protein
MVVAFFPCHRPISDKSSQERGTSRHPGTISINRSSRPPVKEICISQASIMVHRLAQRSAPLLLGLLNNVYCGCV